MMTSCEQKLYRYAAYMVRIDDKRLIKIQSHLTPIEPHHYKDASSQASPGNEWPSTSRKVS